MKSSVQDNKAAQSVSNPSSVHTLLRLLRYALPYRVRIVWAFLCILIVAALSTVSIVVLLPVIQVIFDLPPTVPDRLAFILNWLYELINSLPASKVVSLVAVATVFAAVTAVTGVFRYIQSYLMYWLGYRITLDLQKELFETMSQYHMGYFAKNKVGEVTSHYTVDIRVINIALFNMMGKIILDPFLLLFSLILLLTISWKLTLLYACIFPVLIFVIQYFAKKNRKAGRKAQDYTAELNALVQEHFSHIRLVQGYEMYEHQSRRFTDEALRVFRASMSMMKALSASSPVNEFLGVVATCSVLVVGGYFVLAQNELLAGEFVIYLAALAKLYQPVKRMERSIQDVQIGLASAERVFEALDEKATLPVDPNPIELKSFERDVQIQDVNFGYEDGQLVLRDINLTVNKGDVIAFVGPSGAGKTTLVNLIPRFFDPTSGSVIIDGHDLCSLDLKSLRKRIALVTQDVMIMADTIRSNITCGVDGYSEKDIRSAASAAFADEFIIQMPKQYDTVIGERGTGLSGGQRQRLALARAFLRNSPILILDEATSALDSRSEQHVKQSIQKLMQGRTVFVIAHRLSTILHADKIVVMDEGRIVDQGSHTELLERCNLYQKLYRLQMSGDENVNTVHESAVS